MNLKKVVEKLKEIRFFVYRIKLSDNQLHKSF